MICDDQPCTISHTISTADDLRYVSERSPTLGPSKIGMCILNGYASERSRPDQLIVLGVRCGEQKTTQSPISAPNYHLPMGSAYAVELQAVRVGHDLVP